MEVLALALPVAMGTRQSLTGVENGSRAGVGCSGVEIDRTNRWAWASTVQQVGEMVPGRWNDEIEER
jgi:hypothetical protein